MTDDILRRFRDEVSDPVPSDPFGELVPPSLSRDSEIPNSASPLRSLPLRSIAIGLAGSLAVAFAVLAGGGSDDSGMSTLPRPLTVASAAAAEGQGAPVEYSRSVTTGLGTVGANQPYSYYERVATESWLRDDGSRVVRTVELPPAWPGPRDRARAISAGDTATVQSVAEHRMGASQRQILTADEAGDSPIIGSALSGEALSSDPAGLKAQLVAAGDGGEGGAPEGVRVFELAAGLVLDPAVERSVRAAAYEVLGSLDGITVKSADLDPAGRSATSISITSGYTGAESTRTLYFEPESSRALAATNVLEAPANFIDSRVLSSQIVTDQSLKEGS